MLQETDIDEDVVLSEEDEVPSDGPGSSSSDSNYEFENESDSDIELGVAWEPQQSNPAHQSLYPGAQITEETGAMLILSLATKHRLTHSAISDILRVASMHLPEGTNPTFYRSGFHFSYEHNIIINTSTS